MAYHHIISRRKSCPLFWELQSEREVCTSVFSIHYLSCPSACEDDRQTHSLVNSTKCLSFTFDNWDLGVPMGAPKLSTLEKTDLLDRQVINTFIILWSLLQVVGVRRKDHGAPRGKHTQKHKARSVASRISHLASRRILCMAGYRIIHHSSQRERERAKVLCYWWRRCHRCGQDTSQ